MGGWQNPTPLGDETVKGQVLMDPIPRESKEYLPVPIDGPTDVLTGLDVEMQVRLYPLRPSSTGWKAADWGQDEDGNTVAQVLIGPGTDFDFSASPGTYVPYVRITASPEQPVIEGNPVTIA